LTSRNLLVFTNFTDFDQFKEGMMAFNKNLKNDEKMRNYKYRSLYDFILIKEIRKFLCNEDYDSEKKKKYQRAIELCDQYREFNSKKYIFLSFKISESEEFFSKKAAELEELKKEKRREEEEEEEDEEVYFSGPTYFHTEDDDDYNRNVIHKTPKKSLSIHLCTRCYDICIFCGGKGNYSKTTFYTHEKCYPSKKVVSFQCFVCNAKWAPGNGHLISANSLRYCHQCNKQYNYSIKKYCLVCRQEL
jgi:hypothetical protein